MSQTKTKFLENASVTDSKVATGIDAAKIADGSVSNAEFQFINSLSSNAQTQLNGKQSTALTNTHILVGNGSGVATDVALSGDATLANTGAMTLATVNSNTGIFGSVNEVARVTLDAKGRVTAASNLTISITEGQVTNLVSDLAAKQSTTLTNTHLLVGNGSNLATDVALSGDATLANTGALTIANDAISYAKIQNITTDSLIGRDTAGTGDPETITLNATLEMTGSQVLQRAALTGDVTSSAGSNSTTIPNDTVTFAKMQNIATSKLLGRSTASTGDIEELSVGSGLTLTGGTLASTGTAGTAYNVVSKTTTYTAVINDYIYASSTSFTITLPTAVGVNGQLIAIEHAGTSLTQVYTLNTTSGQTIGGIASGSYALYTAGEVVTLISDNSNWRVHQHKAVTDWDAGATTVVTATTTNPTKATGITVDKIYWRRNGKHAEVRIEYVQSNTTSAALGSGDYLWAMPANIAIDTARMTPFTTVIGGGAAASITNSVGTLAGRIATSQLLVGNVVVYDTNNVRFYVIATTGFGMISSTTSYGFTTPNFATCATFSVPATGWQP